MSFCNSIFYHFFTILLLDSYGRKFTTKTILISKKNSPRLFYEQHENAQYSFILIKLFHVINTPASELEKKKTFFSILARCTKNSKIWDKNYYGIV